MANNVFANGREISCKKADGKSIAAFPDVCMTPPTAPPTPPGVPIPYPNTAMAKDASSGSKTVKISGQEVMMKNKSFFKTSVGNEAGSAPKKGVVTGKIKGKAYFTSWSMDVKVEGENAVRHMDMTTHNHGSIGNTAPWMYFDTADITVNGVKDPCKTLRKDAADKCSDIYENSKYKNGNFSRAKWRRQMCKDEPCRKAMECMLVPYGGSRSPNCCPGYTGDHLVEASSFASTRGGTPIKGCAGYDLKKAPTMCLKGGAYSGDHGHASAMRGANNLSIPEGTLELTDGSEITARKQTYAEAKANGAYSARGTKTQCDEDCMLAQLKAYDKECQISDDTEVRAITYGGEASGRLWEWNQ